jgi:DnaJ-class molecular chaperone
MSDHYQTLGVSKTATPDEIKKAYRKLASKNHPDKGGDTAAFQKIEEAYRVLSDPQQRQAYDNPQPQFAGGGFPGGFSFNFGGSPFDDIFSQFTQHHRPQQRVYSAHVNVTLEQVASNQKQTITLNTQQGVKPFEITMPAAIEDGQRVKYDNLLPDGALVITFRIYPHNVFERSGLDLYMKYNISIWDLISGAQISITDIRGNELQVSIQPKTKPGTSLRLAGRGLEIPGRKGDQYVLLSPVIPDIISDELLELIKQEQIKYS